jgi:hypothetical protein
MGARARGFTAGFGGQGEVQVAQKAQTAAINAATAAEERWVSTVGKDAATRTAAMAQVKTAQAEAAAASTKLAEAEARAAAAVAANTREQLLAAKQAGALAGALARMYVSTLRAGASMAAGVGGALVRPLTSFFLNPVMLALMVIPAVAGFIKSRGWRGDQSQDNPQMIQAYNDQLGITTAQVAKLGSAADGAADLLGNVTTATPMSDVAKFGPDAQRLARNQKGTDPLLSALATTPGGKNDQAALTDLLRSANVTDPRALRLIQEQAFAFGFSPDMIRKASEAVVAEQTRNPRVVASYAGIAKQVMASEGISRGWTSFLGIATSASKSGENLSRQVDDAIKVRFQADQQRFGDKYATQAQFAGQYKFLTSLIKNIKPSGDQTGLQIRATGESFASAFGGKAESYQDALEAAVGRRKQPSAVSTQDTVAAIVAKQIPDALRPYAKQISYAAITQSSGGYQGGGIGGGAGPLAGIPENLRPAAAKVVSGVVTSYQARGTTPGAAPAVTTAEAGQEFLTTLRSTRQGRSVIKEMKTAGFTIDPTKFGQQLGEFMKFGASQTAFTGLGDIGKFATQNKSLQGRLISADPTAQQRGIDQLAKKMFQLTGSVGGTTTALQQLKAVAGSASSPLYQYASAAQQQVQQQMQFKLPQMGRVQQGQYLLGQFQQAQVGLYQHPGVGKAAEDARDQFAAAKQTYQEWGETQRQAMIGQLQTVIQANNQQQRAEEDHGLQMMRAHRDFNNQMARADRDYHLQVARQDRDYHLQVARSTRDFNLQMEHQQRDYHLQVARSEEDFQISLRRETMSAAESQYNPFERIQAQFTENAGTVALLMQEQNDAIQEQFKNLNQLQGVGLSQQSIDVMQLADPKNAQQAETLLQSLQEDPQLVAVLNRQAATRVASTDRLIHSHFNEQFRNTTADFRRQMARAAADVNTARADAQLAQKNSLADSAQDFHNSMADAQRDFHNSMADNSRDFHNSIHDAGVDYKNAMARAGADLALALTDWTGTFGSIYTRMMTNALVNLQKWNPQAARVARTFITQFRAANPALFTPGGVLGPQPTQGVVYPSGIVYFRSTSGAIGYYDPKTGKPIQLKGADLSAFTRYNNTNVLPAVPARTAGFRTGGISTHRQMAWVSEDNQPEVHLPARGPATVGVFADVIAAVSREVGMAMHTAGRGVAGQGQVTNNVRIDKRTEFNGAITVCASDPDKMARELADKARLAKLSRPAYR